MTIRYEIKARPQIDGRALAQMHGLRHDIFRKRLGWQVSEDERGEVDRYDTDDALYMLMIDERDDVRGCWRLLATESPYMLENEFACLLHGQAPRHDARVWELSRFALRQTASCSYGFSEATLGAMRAVVQWAWKKNISEYVTVTTRAIHRLMARAGLDIELYGPAMRVGNEVAVAMHVHMSQITATALFGEQRMTA